jgi:hypothetical protein
MKTLHLTLQRYSELFYEYNCFLGLALYMLFNERKNWNGVCLCVYPYMAIRKLFFNRSLGQIVSFQQNFKRIYGITIEA